MQKTKTLTQTIQKKDDIDLNQWDICDPDKYDDPLPLPYNIINQVLQQTILKNIYLGVHQIQNKKKNPNYQGMVKQIQSHGNLDLDGISYISKDQNNNLNHLILGDRSGNIYIFDVSKKLILCKKQVGVGKRVQYINCSTYFDGEVSITTISVILRGDANVYIFRYRTGQFKLFLNYIIPVSKVKIIDQNTDISTFPYQTKFSNYALHIIVSTYDGNISIYQIPQVSLLKPKQQQSKNKIKSNLNQNSNKSHPSYFANLDQSVITIQQTPLVIPFLGAPIQLTQKQYIQLMLKKKQQKQIIQAPKQQKKQSKKESKKQQKKEQIKQQKKPDKQFNDKVLAGSIILQNNKDCSHDYPLPKFRPHVYILSDQIILPRTKYFQQVKGLKLSTKLVVNWRHLNTVYFYQYQILSQDNIPIFLYQQMYKQSKTSKRSKLFLNKFKELNNLYKVTCLSITHDESLMACGLNDGTITIWDLFTDSIKFNLDRHLSQITSLAFFQSYKLCSGSKDGSVHIDDVSNGHKDMKNTNIFQSSRNYQIEKILISNVGLAYVIDSLGNLRLYDLWRGIKIAKLAASPAYIGSDGKTKKWFRTKPTIFVDDQHACVLSQILISKHEDEITSEQKQQNQINEKNPWRKSTCLQIFKIFQNLLNIFDGLSNIYRRGTDRQKVINIFSNLETKQLNDKSFQIPKIGALPVIGEDRVEPPTKSNKSIKQKDNSSQTSSNSIKSRPKPNNNNQSQHKNVGLTKQALHPQMQLFKRRQTPKTILANEKWMIQRIRQSHGKKELRQTKLLREINKEQGIQ